MAEVEQKESGEKKKGAQKKMKIHVDFTPMVDMNVLLITFFMLCTTMSKPQTMEISMPSNDKVTEEEQNKVKASQAITILLGDKDRVFYYEGEPQYDDYTSLKESSYEADGLRAMLQNRNHDVVVLIKASEASTYKNLIDALDEMQICSISKYAIVDMTDGDKFLIENFEGKGSLSAQAAEVKANGN